VLKKVLVANRGEIAVRILRTLREMGIASVAVYSDADRDSLHVRRADQAYPIGPAPAVDSYLRIDRLIDAAKRSGADGLAPGYGFLAENPELAEACEGSGIRFIGPPASAMRLLGSKVSARRVFAEAGAPIVPGGEAGSVEEATATAERVGYPILLKANAGGGGKGMRRVESQTQLLPLLERARSEAGRAFGDDSVYIEKVLSNPRHVEIQLMGDQEGNLVHLFERDCSIQRRFQKVVEETPCPAITAELVERMAVCALRGARDAGYYSAGTVEFLLDEHGQFYFLEMNTRLQVEHPITELCTGIDLVKQMLHVASGGSLLLTQEQVVRSGVAIQCRVYAENPARGFLPSPGRIGVLIAPSGPGVRDDSGITSGSWVSPNYDPLISKLCVWAPDRDTALARMRRALGEYVVTGIDTNLAFHQSLFQHPEFVGGRYDTGFIDRHLAELAKGTPIGESDRTALALAIAVSAYASERGAREGRGLDGPSPWLAAHRARLAAGRNRVR
jgi:acetyl-CoA carboxylase biotin carboxylase subunit